MEDNLANLVIQFYKDNKWKEILQLNEDINNDSARKLLWVWPCEANLIYIKQQLQNHKLDGITSLGCGCGLLEWIFQSATGIPVIGIEVNESWWISKYSVPPFIPLQFANTSSTTSKLLRTDYALLFCYFNDGPAFKEYVDSYEGKLIIIIGPGEGRGTYTNPEPFKADFGSNSWSLVDSQEVKCTKDFIAVYKRLDDNV